MIEFLLFGGPGPEGTNDLLYLIISNDGHYKKYTHHDSQEKTENGGMGATGAFPNT